ncbi:MAG: glutathionylspermidine synthase [Azospirillum sp.]|nr:glutathionylspermidine synthase [Azospirillum sp.]
MRRLADTPPRKNWQSGLRKYRYGEAAAAAAVRWSEAARYEFTAGEIDRIEAAADDLCGLIHDAVRHAIESRLLPLYGISRKVANLIEAGWARYYQQGRADPRQGGLYGRLDLAYDGSDSLKLLGCCFDGPAGLFEASIVQWSWLEATHPDADQFNGLHEGLVERFQTLSRGLRGRDQLHLTCSTPDAALEGELAYLAAVADEAGYQATVIPIQDIGWDGARFRDLDDAEMRWLLKLYPWEVLAEDDFGHHLDTAPTVFLDPVWRMPASNHGLLATLWELYPEHPNLTAATLSSSGLPAGVPVLERSFFGLDRAASRLIEHGAVVADTGPAATPGGTVYLARPQLFEQDGIEAVLECWMVGDKCLGMTVREADDRLIGAGAAVVPHLFR